jgi:hypothetical protein
MKTETRGRPKNPPGGRRNTLVLDATAAELVDDLSRRFEEKWGAIPTLTVLVTRALTLAGDQILDMPPDHERLRVAQIQLRKIREYVDVALRSPKRDVLFALHGEATHILQRVAELRGSIQSRKKEWSGYRAALEECEETIYGLTTELARIADAMRR